MSDAVALDAGDREALQGHAPFADMDAAAWAWIAAHHTVATYFAGAEIIQPGRDSTRRLVVVVAGQVHCERVHLQDPADEPVADLGPGRAFPVTAVFTGVGVATVYRALTRVRCLVLEAADVIGLAGISPPFLRWAMEQIGVMLHAARSGSPAAQAHIASDEQTMASPLRGLMRGPPVTASPGLPVRTALAAMREAKVGSVVIVADDARPVGIFTLQDLLHRVAPEGTGLDAPIASVMTPDPLTLPAESSAYDGALLMARHGARHVPVVDDGRLVGLVSQRDLFFAQRATLRQMPEAIAAARNLPDLQQAAADIRTLGREMLISGVAAERLMHFIAVLNDRLAHRLIDIELPRHGLGGVKFCWIALGSEGRLEQAFATDQDNGLIFEAPAGVSVDAVRERFAPFTLAVNQALDACGFPLCKGRIMASNPRWCLSLAEWQAQFGSWMRNPDPDALLNSTIFFDFRSVYGDARLAERLRDWLLGTSQATPLFLRHLAEGALNTSPPLGRFRDFRFDSKEHPGTIDLKLYGLRPYVEAARIHALRFGIAHTNTGQRLRLAGPHLRLPPGEIQAMVDGFYFIQLLRLRHQQFDAGARGGPNRIEPGKLNPLERRILIEAFRQARNLQVGLGFQYSI